LWKIGAVVVFFMEFDSVKNKDLNMIVPEYVLVPEKDIH